MTGDLQRIDGLIDLLVEAVLREMQSEENEAAHRTLPGDGGGLGEKHGRNECTPEHPPI